jgi:hypothetical protein
MECAQQETPTAIETATEMEGVKLPKNCKENRYYYRHREEILEKKRLARLSKKGIDVTKSTEELKETLEEKRKKKMVFLGLMSDKK